MVLIQVGMEYAGTSRHCMSLCGMSCPLDVTDSSTIDSSSSSSDVEVGDEGYSQNSVLKALAMEGWCDCLPPDKLSRLINSSIAWYQRLLCLYHVCGAES